MALQGRQKTAWPVKADLAIYSPVSGVSVWCWSLAFMPSYKWDFNIFLCDLERFLQIQSHIAMCLYPPHDNKIYTQRSYVFFLTASITHHVSRLATKMDGGMKRLLFGRIVVIHTILMFLIAGTGCIS